MLCMFRVDGGCGYNDAWLKKSWVGRKEATKVDQLSLALSQSKARGETHDMAMHDSILGTSVSCQNPTSSSFPQPQTPQTDTTFTSASHSILPCTSYKILCTLPPYSHSLRSTRSFKQNIFIEPLLNTVHAAKPR